MKDALLDGNRVATNLDIRIKNLLPYRRRNVDLQRLPDKPTATNMKDIGLGTPEPDESRNGLIVLDELGTWLNSRNFNQEGRKEFIDRMLHSRKMGWDIFLICQHLNQIDKQILEDLVDYHVICKRLDRMKIPFLGRLLSIFTFGLLSGNIPPFSIIASTAFQI